VGFAEASQGFGEHAAAVSVPKLQLEVPDTVYPSLHSGWHVEPEASDAGQSPDVPSAGAVSAPAHGAAWQVAAVNVPAWQSVTPDAVYPWLQVGWQVEPDCSIDATQSPAAPLTGATFAPVQEFALHVAAMSTGGEPLLLQADAPETVYPASQFGWH